MKRKVMVSECQEELNTYERDVTREEGAWKERGDMGPHVEKVIDAAVIAVRLKRVRGGIEVNSPFHRVPKEPGPGGGDARRVVGDGAMESLPPLKFVCKKLLNHQSSLRVCVTKGVPINDGMVQKIYEDADPVGVAVVDGEAKVAVKKRIDTEAMRVETEPGERVVA